MKKITNSSSAKSLIKILISMIILVFFTTNHLLSQTEFDPANQDKSEKAVKSLVNVKIDDLKKHGVKKLIIFGCKGDFVLSRETVKETTTEKGDYFNTITRTTRTEVSETLDPTYCVLTTTRLLDSVIALFNRAGIEVVPVQTWQQHPVYQEMLKMMMEVDVDESTRYKAFMKTATTTGTMSVPAIDYRIEPENLIKMIKYEKLRTQDRGKMLEDFGAQAFCSIAFSIDGLTQRPNLTGLALFFETGMKKYDMGTKDKDGNKVFMYSLTSNPVLNLKGMLKYHIPTLTDSKKAVDTNKFDRAILEMQSYILSIYEDKLKMQ